MGVSTSYFMTYMLQTCSKFPGLMQVVSGLQQARSFREVATILFKESFTFDYGYERLWDFSLLNFLRTHSSSLRIICCFQDVLYEKNTILSSLQS